MRKDRSVHRAHLFYWLRCLGEDIRLIVTIATPHIAVLVQIVRVIGPDRRSRRQLTAWRRSRMPPASRPPQLGPGPRGEVELSCLGVVVVHGGPRNAWGYS